MAEIPTREEFEELVGNGAFCEYLSDWHGMRGVRTHFGEEADKRRAALLAAYDALTADSAAKAARIAELEAAAELAIAADAYPMMDTGCVCAQCRAMRKLRAALDKEA